MHDPQRRVLLIGGHLDGQWAAVDRAIHALTKETA